MMITKKRCGETSRAVYSRGRGSLKECLRHVTRTLNRRAADSLRHRSHMAELTAPITTTLAFDMARSNRWAKRRMIRFQNGSALSPHSASVIDDDGDKFGSHLVRACLVLVPLNLLIAGCRPTRRG
jgi:hypothetical protein